MSRTRNDHLAWWHIHMSLRKQRGRAREALFADIDPQVMEAVRQATAARGVHQWWVVEQALRAGLPLIPQPEQEVLPQSA